MTYERIRSTSKDGAQCAQYCTVNASVCRAAHAIGHSGLIVEIVHEDIHNVP